MPMVSRKRSRLLVTWILAAALVAPIGGSHGMRAWAGEPDSNQGPQTSLTPAGQLSAWAILHGIYQGGVLLPPLP